MEELPQSLHSRTCYKFQGTQSLEDFDTSERAARSELRLGIRTISISDKVLESKAFDPLETFHKDFYNAQQLSQVRFWHSQEILQGVAQFIHA